MCSPVSCGFTLSSLFLVSLYFAEQQQPQHVGPIPQAPTYERKPSTRVHIPLQSPRLPRHSPQTLTLHIKARTSFITYAYTHSPSYPRIPINLTMMFPLFLF